MTLAASGEMSIGGSVLTRSINLEVGRTATATSGMNDSALRSLSGITTPGSQISISDFYNKSAVTLQDYNAGTYNIVLTRFAGALFPSTATARVGINLANDGTAVYYYSTHAIGQTNLASFNWLVGGGGVGDYYAFMSAPTGDAFSVNAGTDTSLVLSTSRNWRLDVSSSSGSVSKSLTSTLQIRNSSGNVLVSKTLQFNVTAESS